MRVVLYRHRFRPVAKTFLGEYYQKNRIYRRGRAKEVIVCPYNSSIPASSLNFLPEAKIYSFSLSHFRKSHFTSCIDFASRG